MWGVLTAGGAGVEWFFGSGTSSSDRSIEDFRSRDSIWTWTRAASDFFETLPVTEMRQEDAATSGTSGSDYVFAKPGEIYAIYLPQGGSATLDLRAYAGDYVVRWFNPRSVGAFEEGTVRTVEGGALTNLGAPPADASKDWVILVRRDGSLPPPPPPPGEALARYYLADAGTDQFLMEVVQGSVIDAALLEGRSLTLVAVGNGANPSAAAIESVRMNLDAGVVTRLESSVPYALFGDQRGDLTGGLSLASGQHQVRFDFYSADAAQGTLLGSESFSFTVGSTPPADTTAPTANLSVSDAALTAGETATVTFQFSEAVIDFTASDVTTTNGTLTEFKKVAAQTYTAVFTPATNTKGSATVAVLADSYTDVAGNGGAGAQTSLSIDTLVISSALGRYYLADAGTDQFLMELVQGSVIDPALFDGRSLTLVAVENGANPSAAAIESVRMNLDAGAVTRLESTDPYSLFGDLDGNFRGGLSLASGQHQVRFDFYSADDAQGTVLGSESFSFHVNEPFLI
jgi:hypothetical protein